MIVSFAVNDLSACFSVDNKGEKMGLCILTFMKNLLKAFKRTYVVPIT